MKLTDWECLRTQSEYDSSLTFKLYVLQFVNYYSSLFYIAFFKGRFTGRPGDYNLVFGARQEEVGIATMTPIATMALLIVTMIPIVTVAHIALMNPIATVTTCNSKC